MKDGLKVFVCSDHDGHYVGVASVMVAKSREDATKRLDLELMKAGLATSKTRPYIVLELNTGAPSATILQDGDY